MLISLFCNIFVIRHIHILPLLATAHDFLTRVQYKYCCNFLTLSRSRYCTSSYPAAMKQQSTLHFTGVKFFLIFILIQGALSRNLPSWVRWQLANLLAKSTLEVHLKCILLGWDKTNMTNFLDVHNKHYWYAIMIKRSANLFSSVFLSVCNSQTKQIWKWTY